jgi:hypothetical protein
MKSAHKKGPFTVRLPVALEERINAQAAEQKTSPSAITRLALQRGLAAMERESTPAVSPPPAPPPNSTPTVAQRRRGVLSPGVG